MLGFEAACAQLGRDVAVPDERGADTCQRRRDLDAIATLAHEPEESIDVIIETNHR